MIAEPFFLTQYAEKAGSGTTDMIDACHRAGLPTPEFRTDPHRFVTILYRAAKPMVIGSPKPMVIATSESGNERDFEVKAVGVGSSKKPMVIGNEKTEVIAKEE